ncbi:hypothetical protein DMN91_001404 [Ooceraea biroi]|uniref:Uncharacterized protein n=1 Tax=Ooceraea biroi TaxID=2015173 RepID=A0A026W3Z7_OOCBI|nr:uncharacterized protein LOC113562081 [Ooceraea biroi]EZA50728.1 hypothetical protein X777_10778 [Ooceraea biroi]RLU27600.1 hypothetical protein DMN91_001404 [Ooceraea biroi]
MRIITVIFLVLGLALHVRCEENNRDENNGITVLECLFAESTGHCLRTKLARDLDQIELQVTGKKSEPPVSVVIEEAGNILAEIVDDVQETGGRGFFEEDDAQDDNTEMARKKKRGKKKMMGKLMGMMMMMKSKITILLQLISLHLQKKFLVIAIISLILNAVRFWIEVKKNQPPAKVIYYEHAQHQHHYDHDDHDHWGRSSNETPQEIVYHAYAPK